MVVSAKLLADTENMMQVIPKLARLILIPVHVFTCLATFISLGALSLRRL